MFGVSAQTRVHGGNRSHDSDINKLALLDYQITQSRILFYIFYIKIFEAISEGVRLNFWLFRKQINSLKRNVIKINHCAVIVTPHLKLFLFLYFCSALKPQNFMLKLQYLTTKRFSCCYFSYHFKSLSCWQSIFFKHFKRLKRVCKKIKPVFNKFFLFSFFHSF